MFRLLRKNRGQSTLEYAILIVVVIVALVGVQAYLRRSIEGRQREGADQIGDQFHAWQTEYNYTTTTSANVTEIQDAWSTTTNYTDHSVDRSGYEVIGNFETQTYR